MPSSIAIQSIVSELPWKRSIGRRFAKDIKYAIVHHDAELVGGTYDAIDRYKHEANYHIGKDWGHLSYTFKIDRSGHVYQCLPLEECGAQAGNYFYFRNSLGICLDGSFDKQQPSAEQVDALRKLLYHLAYEAPEMPLLTRKNMYVHNEVRFLPTFCPGPTIKKVVVDFRNGVDLSTQAAQPIYLDGPTFASLQSKLQPGDITKTSDGKLYLRAGLTIEEVRARK